MYAKENRNDYKLLNKKKALIQVLFETKFDELTGGEKRLLNNLRKDKQIVEELKRIKDERKN